MREKNEGWGMGIVGESERVRLRNLGGRGGGGVGRGE
jgi:hypothetical protein